MVFNESNFSLNEELFGDRSAIGKNNSRIGDKVIVRSNEDNVVELIKKMAWNFQ